jgi:hypothetical protein
MPQVTVRNAAKPRQFASEKPVGQSGKGVYAWHRYCFSNDRQKLLFDCHNKIKVEVTKLKGKCMLTVHATDIYSTDYIYVAE